MGFLIPLEFLDLGISILLLPISYFIIRQIGISLSQKHEVWLISFLLYQISYYAFLPDEEDVFLLLVAFCACTMSASINFIFWSTFCTLISQKA